MKSLILKREFVVVILIVTALLSVFVLSKVASSPDFHANTIQALDDKKIIVMELTTATVVTSTALAAIPSESTDPLANQIIQLSEYLLIIMGVIFLEKILLTLTGYVTFTYLIPIACLLYGLSLYVKKDILKNIAIKLVVFGIVSFMIVPISVNVSNLVENTYKDSISQTVEEVKNIKELTEEINDESNGDKGIWEKIVSGTKEIISNIGNTISNFTNYIEQLLNKFIDAIAVLLITSCVIPILVLMLFGWIIKMFFGVKIPVKEVKDKILSSKKNDE